MVAYVKSGSAMQSLQAPLVALLLAAFVSYVLTPYVRKFAIAKGAVDDPTRDDRRVHTTPIPRWGGLAIYAGIVVATLVMFFVQKQQIKPYIWGLLGIGGMLVVVGALDDLYQYKAKLQALILLGAGFVIQFLFDDPKSRVHIFGFDSPLSSNYIELGVWGYFATAFYIFVVTKTMDTIDGIDGLTAGIATIAATTLTLIAVYEGQPRVALLTAATAGASLGFLRHNYNPAKIFMGTGGAYVLGFTLACLSVVGTLKTAAAAAIFMPLLIFGLPLVDAVNVVTRRIINKVPITQPDKRHLHHELLARGLTQRQTVLVLYTATAALCVIGLLLVRVFGK
jgi:UDP-GlcNAc:undecaprenyl-phosphate/decaprenyl-phosphate GlcNAc-1-phosphate transferase